MLVSKAVVSNLDYPVAGDEYVLWSKVAMAYTLFLEQQSNLAYWFDKIPKLRLAEMFGFFVPGIDFFVEVVLEVLVVEMCYVLWPADLGWLLEFVPLQIDQIVVKVLQFLLCHFVELVELVFVLDNPGFLGDEALTFFAQFLVNRDLAEGGIEDLLDELRILLELPELVVDKHLRVDILAVSHSSAFLATAALSALRLFRPAQLA